MYFVATAYADTAIVVRNNTAYALTVSEATTAGAVVSDRAWAPGAALIARGESETVMVLVRAGKDNWMDPTPQFIQPGETVIFITTIGVSSIDGGAPIQLRQKLKGAGKTTNLWYSIDGMASAHDWQNDLQSHDGTWQLDAATAIDIRYRAFVLGGDTHIEYVFGPRDE